MAEFSIVSMMREDADVVERFIDYYRGQNAGTIKIYFDGAVDHLSTLDLRNVQLIECNAEFWHPICGARPVSMSAAQEQIYMHCLAQCETEWLYVTDADEFLFGNMLIPEFLDAVPADTEVVRVRSAEAVWGPGDDVTTPFGSSYFRTPILNSALRLSICALVYGQTASMFRFGILSHIEGKQFIRVSSKVDKISNHDSKRNGESIGVWAHELDPALGGMYLGHFDAISLDRWREKWRRRYSGETTAPGMSKRRNRQMEAIKSSVTTTSGEKLFRKLYYLNRRQFFTLSVAGCAFKKEIFRI